MEAAASGLILLLEEEDDDDFETVSQMWNRSVETVVLIASVVVFLRLKRTSLMLLLFEEDILYVFYCYCRDC